MSDSTSFTEKSPWAWIPPVPIETSPVFAWPPRPIPALKYLLGRGFVLSENAAYVGLALVTWFYLAPSLDRWHALHHRNVNIGPSDCRCIPIEHVLYLSVIVIHLAVASHPMHLFFLMYHTVLAAITSHTGYADLLINGKPRLDVGSFFHQLHHRYFDCNYGSAVMPWDRWLGSFHDGAPASTARLRERQRRLRGKKPAL